MKKKPRLSFWQIWNMSFGFLGIQFGFALQNANVSRIFETLGADVDKIPILWVAAPITGLIVQPIIGHLSDNTWGRLGRRRPFFLIGAIFASIALFIMPNSPTWWIAAGMLWIMDASINISMEPFRAFIGDMLPSEQRTTGFAMQSFFIGTGAVIASALPYVLTEWFHIANTAPDGQIPPSVKISFYIGAVVFIGAVLWTVISSKEYSPDEMKEFSDTGEAEEVEHETIKAGRDAAFIKNGIIWTIIGLALSLGLFFTALPEEMYILTFGIAAFGVIQLISGALLKAGKDKNGMVVVINDFYEMPKTMVQLAFVQFFSWFALFAMWIYTTAGVTSHIYDMKIDHEILSKLNNTFSSVVKTDDNEKDIDKISTELDKYKSKFANGDTSVVVSMRTVKFFLTGTIIPGETLIEKVKQKVNSKEEFKNKFIETNQLEDKDANAYLSQSPEKIDITYETVKWLAAAETDPVMKDKLQTYTHLKYIQHEYNTGANWVGVCFAVYNGFAAVMAFLLMGLAKITSRKTTHSIALIVGGISLASIYIIGNPTLLLVSFVGIGLAWASILAMPYAILTGALPAKKMGTYMGIFNFFIVIPQILAASVLGFFVTYLFDGQAIFSLILGGISMILAALLVSFVKDEN